MLVNFIITCYDKEEFLKPLSDILKGYKLIKPVVALAYNGSNETFPCSVRLDNLGHQLGEYSLIKAGYETLKDNGVKKWVKLSIDSWLTDEAAILRIFGEMEKARAVYGGNFWNTTSQVSTDIFFADTSEKNVFENFNLDEKDVNIIKAEQAVLENFLARAVGQTGAAYIINEREPVHPNNRHECSKLKWTMYDTLEENLSKKDQWAAPFDLEAYFKDVETCKLYE